MDFFDRHKALIITLLIFAVLLLGMYNLKISGSNREIREMLVDLENMKLEEQTKEPEETKEISAQQTREAIRTHQAFNENTEARQADFDQQLQEILEKNALQQESSDPSAIAGAGSYNLSKPGAESKSRSDGDRRLGATSLKTGGLRDSSISFSLKDRTAVNIPNPVYTCSTSGKIVINIKVDAGGRVTDTSVNKGSSTSSNQCLIDQAMEYASRAVFSELADRNSQPGTITYHFKP